MSWRTRSRALLLALAVTSLTTSAWAQVELTFRFNDAEQKELRAALDLFEQGNPDIKVALERTAWADAREQFLREAAVGEGPDVVHIAQVWTRSMGDAGVFTPLNDLIDEHGVGAGWDDFISADLASQDDGTIHAIPWTVDTFAMVYRKDLLEQAGITEFPTTWDELREARRAPAPAAGPSPRAVLPPIRSGSSSTCARRGEAPTHLTLWPIPASKGVSPGSRGDGALRDPTAGGER